MQRKPVIEGRAVVINPEDQNFPPPKMGLADTVLDLSKSIGMLGVRVGQKGIGLEKTARRVLEDGDENKALALYLTAQFFRRVDLGVLTPVSAGIQTELKPLAQIQRAARLMTKLGALHDAFSPHVGPKNHANDEASLALVNMNSEDGGLISAAAESVSLKGRVLLERAKVLKGKKDSFFSDALTDMVANSGVIQGLDLASDRITRSGIPTTVQVLEQINEKKSNFNLWEKMLSRLRL